MPTDLHFLTVAQAASLIADRELSPVELTDAYLARIATLDNQLASFVTVTADRARRQARSAEADIMTSGPRSKLHGIPYCLKDIYDTAGIRTTAQSKLLADNVPAEDSFCQTRLAEAGAILLGKNATWEFAHGGPSWDVLFPPARNPWNTDHSPDGSSSGSAAAVAAGFAPATMGTDTGGSIRGPAAACGIAGLKPTYGRVSRRGVIPNCFSHDHAGPLAWTDTGTVDIGYTICSTRSTWVGLAPGSASNRAATLPSRITITRWLSAIVSSRVSESSTIASPRPHISRTNR
ncbi:MAG: aspartyl-tRNA(Asn)/glutamyl-tRNA(Gln) amidotransferase subunit [Pseudonocardiales bacterium]|nr:aspartyl-tRNA(Asn)/glutamyl-tRNA(Gln) amidotransferase subunit [Pseudonocardiales bacterium]